MCRLLLCKRLPIALLVLLLAGCAQTAVVAPASVTITIAGSSEMHPVLNDLASAYSARHPNVLFSIQGGGSILGERWLENRQVDLAATTAFRDGEETPEIMRIPIGLDGIAVIVHSNNSIADTVAGLTIAQLRDMYSGKVLDWHEVGSQTGDVLLVSREDGSATRSLFEERVMDKESVALTAVVMPTSQDVVDYVASHSNAIGYVSRSYLRTDSKLSIDGTSARAEDVPVRLVALEGRLPVQQEIAAQSYFLTRPIFLLRHTKDTAILQPVIDFILSPVGQEIVARYHVRIR